MKELKRIKKSYEIHKLLEEFEIVFPNLFRRINNLQEYSLKLEKYANVYAAYIDKNCFGILVMYANNMETKEGYISLVGIKKEFEQKGMGTYLIKMAERYAMEAGMEKLKLEVDNNNVHAQRFYKRNNFVFGATTDRNSMYMIKDLPIKKSTYSS